MLFSSTWAPLGLLVLGVKGVWAHSRGEVANSSTHNAHRPPSPYPQSPTDCESTSVAHTANITVNVTETSATSTWITKSSTTTIHYTDSAITTSTDTTTTTVPATTTEQETTTVQETTTLKATTTVQETTTTYSTQTIISTTVDPCPTTCSISAGTVNLFFWPTDRPYTYPSTYVDTNLAYTFTSPSVYMLIPTAVGTNSLERVGPSTTDWILPLDLDEVSTIVDGSITSQLVLSDLGTDCPSTAEPSAIATMVNPRCDPILAAPRQVSSWASPCNACGRFGLFDPPYAIPTITGGLLGTTTATTTATTATTAPSASVVTTVVPVPTATSSAATTTSAEATTETSASVITTGAPVPSSPVGSSTATTSTTSAAPPLSSPVVASATRATGGLALLISGIFAGSLLL